MNKHHIYHLSAPQIEQNYTDVCRDDLTSPIDQVQRESHSESLQAQNSRNVQFSDSDLPNWQLPELISRNQNMITNPAICHSSISMSNNRNILLPSLDAWQTGSDRFYSSRSSTTNTISVDGNVTSYRENSIVVERNLRALESETLQGELSSVPSQVSDTTCYNLSTTDYPSTVLTESYNVPLQTSSFSNFASSVGFELASASLQSSSSSVTSNQQSLLLDSSQVDRRNFERMASSTVTPSYSHRIDCHNELSTEVGVENGVLNCELNNLQESYPVEPEELPSEWDTEVVSLQRGPEGSNIIARVAIHTSDEFERWFNCFQLKTDCAYRVIRTFPRHGKYVVFKSEYQCNHMLGGPPRGGRSLTTDVKSKICPVKVSVTIKSVPLQRSRSTDKYLPRYPAVVRIRNSHNHEIAAMLDVKDKYLLFDGKDRDERPVELSDRKEEQEQETDEEDEKGCRQADGDPVKSNSRRVLTNIVDDIMRRFDNNPEKFTRSINLAARNYYTSLHTERTLLASLRNSFRRNGCKKSLTEKRTEAICQKRARVRRRDFKRTMLNDVLSSAEVNIPEHGYVKQASLM